MAAWKKRGAIVMRNGEAFPLVDCIILAVKPSDFSALEINISPSTFVISVMAGVSIATIRKKLSVRSVARVMMNIAAEHGGGLAVWHAPKVSTIERGIIRAICVEAGRAQEVAREADVDRATVILGSGPAFLLRAFADLTVAASSLSISRKDAVRMTLSAFAVAQLLSTKESDPERLIARIASKGGTTEAGLRVFDGAKTRATWSNAVRAAYTRAAALRKSAQ